MNPIQVRGYSERGMINSICYEIRYSPYGLRLLRDFLGLCTFPHSKPDFSHFRSAALLIEQSFSDFGDLDLLMLLKGDCTHAVCLEAKVKTSEANNWSLDREWKRFRDSQTADGRRSNLFMQLYRKMRLLKQVRSVGEEMAADSLARRWSLGKNAIVRKAARELSTNCAEAWMIALVPESKGNAQGFFETHLSSPPPGLSDWEYTNFGYLTWQEFAEHCANHAAEWPETPANFEYNRGQIFALSYADSRPPAGSVVTWNSPSGPQQVTVKNGHKHNTCVYLSDRSTVKVPNRELEW